MKIEKLACCLAHPVTALRSIKAKVDEIIEAVNHIALTGGSGGGGSFLVNCSTTPLDEEGTSFALTPDRTFQECLTAFQAGVIPYLNIDMDGTGEMLFVLSPICIMNNDLQFGAYVGGITMLADYYDSNVDGIEHQCMLKMIGGG